MKIRTAVLVAAIGLSVGLSACQTVTPYQPLQRGTRVSGGYSDQRLDSNNYLVMFRGNTDTPRATVETYLLYRAAEITVAQGFDWFETVERHTERQGQAWITPDPFYGPGYAWGAFRPSWNFYGGGNFGWRGWGPWGWGPGWGPGWGSVNVTTVQQFEASAQIVMRHGPKPVGYSRGLDAREVLTNLGPRIIRPPPPRAAKATSTAKPPQA